MKNFLLFITLIMAGCAFQQPYEIAQPPGPSNIVIAPADPPIVVQSDKPLVTPPSQGQAVPPQVKIWRPDPTWILICNDSLTLHLEVWIDSGPPDPPTLKKILVPKLCQDVYVMLGDHFWYAIGYIETLKFGRVPMGPARRDFYIRNWSYYGGGYSLRIPINDGDFGR